MALIDDVKRVCTRLARHGWKPLLAKHGLDITAADLEHELDKPLTVERQLPGFEDFALEGRRAIEPGRPARSLLLHALASPGVVRGANGRPLAALPTPAEIDTVENYIFARRAASVAELRRQAEGDLLAIVVFACEYRRAVDTVHRKHADLALSRTGIARVGTTAANFSPEQRGFVPFARDPHAVCVLPARYTAWIAVQRRGNRPEFGPLGVQRGDGTRQFWVPLHKLFSGPECLVGLDLTLGFRTFHLNEKLRRIHLALRRRRTDGGWGEPDISQPPFAFSDGIAELSDDPQLGPGWLVPAPHPLVEIARYRGEMLTFIVPRDGDVLSSSVRIPDVGDARQAPEYVHARHLVQPDGSRENLNDDTDVETRVERGGYRAQHYVDYSGDGWVEAVCPEVAVEIPRNVPAYSLVTPPDFFPAVGQRELLEWTEQSVPQRLRRTIWVVPPATLAHSRLAPNLQLPGARFRPEDDTVTAIVSLPVDGDEGQTPLRPVDSPRHLHLPDTAAGEFAPGWDVSWDRGPDGTRHLAAYGLGSPFPEDAKLCAALSTFWPAVAPDTARKFVPDNDWPTVSPLTDDELGASGDAWDGISGPKLVREGDRWLVDYPSFPHVDYVEQSLGRKFSFPGTGRVSQDEYHRRVLFTARLYAALGVTTTDPDRARREKARWAIRSFRPAPPGDTERKDAEQAAGAALGAEVRRFEVYRPGPTRAHPTDHRRVRVEVRELVTAYLDAVRVLLRRDGGTWRSIDG